MFCCRFTASDYPFGIFKLFLYYPKDPTLFGIRYSSILQTGEIRIVLLLKMPVKATLLQLSRRASTQKYGYQFCLSFYDLLILFGIAITVRYVLGPAYDSMRRYRSYSVCLSVISFIRTSRICFAECDFSGDYCRSYGILKFSCICNIVVHYEPYSSDIICLIAFIFGRIIGHDV